MKLSFFPRAAGMAFLAAFGLCASPLAYGASIQAEADVLDLGWALPGQSVVRTLHLGLATGVSGPVPAVEPRFTYTRTRTSTTHPEEFQVDSSNTCASEIPSGGCDLAIRFSPQTLGTKSARVQLLQRGVYRGRQWVSAIYIYVSGTSGAAPVTPTPMSLSVWPEDNDMYFPIEPFGTSSLGKSVSKTILLHRFGGQVSDSATLTSIPVLSFPFSYVGGSFPGTGGTCAMVVQQDCSIVVQAIHGSFRRVGPLIFQFGYSTSVDSGLKTNSLTLLKSYQDGFHPLDTDLSFGNVAVGETYRRVLSFAGFEEYPIDKVEFDALPDGFRWAGGLNFPGEGGTCVPNSGLSACTAVLEFKPTSASRFQGPLHTVVYAAGEPINEYYWTAYGDGFRRIPQTETLLVLGGQGQATYRKDSFTSFSDSDLQEAKEVSTNVSGRFRIGPNGMPPGNLLDGFNSGKLWLEFSASQPGRIKSFINVSYRRLDGSRVENASPIYGRAKGIDPAQNVLVLYNTNSPESVSLASYYRDNRPKFKTVNLLGVATSTTEFVASMDAFKAEIGDPVTKWLAAHPTKDILFVVMMYGMPTRTTGGDVGLFNPIKNVPAQIRDLMAVYRQAKGYGFSESGFVRGASVHLLDMGSAEATRAYIDKLAFMFTQMRVKSMILNASVAQLAGKNYYLDDYTPAYSGFNVLNLARDLLAFLFPSGLVPSPIQYQSTTDITTATDVLGYANWGYNGALGQDYAINGSVRFSGRSNWYLMQTIESFNGQRNSFQGNFVRWFSKTAFGSTNYDFTPVGAVVHLEEPQLSGIHSRVYFPLWQLGNLFSDAAGISRSSPAGLAIGDPLIRK